MRKYKYIIFPFLLVIAFLTMHFYNQWYYKELYKKPKMYPYESFIGPANHVLIISDIKYKDELVFHYEYVKKNKKYKSFSFPLKGLPVSEPVYILGYSEDSLVAEVVSLYYRGAHFGGGFTQGWVATSVLHKEPPPDSLMPLNYKKHIADTSKIE